MNQILPLRPRSAGPPSVPVDRSPVGPAPWIDRLAERIDRRRACVAVIGAGPGAIRLGQAATRAGFRTLEYGCAGTNPCTLTARIDPGEPPPAPFWARMLDAEAILIAVPPPGRGDAFDQLRAVGRTVAWHMHPGQLVVLAGAERPDAAAAAVRPILDATGLRCGEDILLAGGATPAAPAPRRAGPQLVPPPAGPAEALAAALFDALATAP